jgi:hypothetical protein
MTWKAAKRLYRQRIGKIQSASEVKLSPGTMPGLFEEKENNHG